MKHVWTAAFACGVVAFVGLTLYNTLRLAGGYTPDSLFYIDAARNTLAGRGLVSSMAELDRLMAADQALPVPFTLWAPGYPISIAAVSAMGISATASAFVVAAVAYGGVLFGGFLLARRQAGSAAGALAVGLLAQMPPLLVAAQTAWSETLGLLLLLIAMWLVLAPAGDRAYTPFVAGVLAGLAFDTRYALLPIVAFAPAVYVARLGREGVRAALLCAAGSVITAAPVVLRNFTGTGLPSGAGDVGNQIGIVDNLARLSPALGASLWNGGFLFSTTMVLLGAAIVYMIVLRRREAKANEAAQRAFWTGAAVLGAWAFVYLAFLLAAQLRVRVDPLNARLLLPMTVVVPPLVAAGVARIGMYKSVISAFAVVFLGIAIYAQADNARLVFGTRIPPVYAVDERIPKEGAVAWLARRVNPEDLIIAEDGLDLPLYLGPVNTAFFSEAHTPGFRLDEQTLIAYVETHACTGGKVWLVVANRPDTAEDFHCTLSRGDMAEYARIQVAAVFHDYRVYTIACETVRHGE